MNKKLTDREFKIYTNGLKAGAKEGVKRTRADLISKIKLRIKASKELKKENYQEADIAEFVLKNLLKAVEGKI